MSFFCQCFQNPPSDFNPRVEVAGCFCVHNGEILLLKRNPKSSQGNTWGIPAGKIEQGESPLQAVVREMYEETGLKFELQSFNHMGRLYYRHPTVDYTFHMFRYQCASVPEVTLAAREHVEYKWVTTSEAKTMPLIAGGIEVMDFYEGFKDGNA